MKKTFTIEFEYNEDAKSISETFGSTNERMDEIVSDVLQGGAKYKTFTGAVVAKMEDGSLQGGDIMAFLANTFAGAQDEMKKRMLGEMFGGGMGSGPEALRAMLEKIKAKRDAEGKDGEREECTECDSKADCLSGKACGSADEE